PGGADGGRIPPRAGRDGPLPDPGAPGLPPRHLPGPREVSSAGRARWWLRRVAVVLVVAWAVRRLVVTGGEVMGEPLRTRLVPPPWTQQAMGGNGFEMSLVRINGEIPRSDRVIVAWIDPPNPDYVFFYSTYWLYPRKVT